MGAGHWGWLTCGSPSQIDRTCVGVVFYDDLGELAEWRWAGFERATRRGDWRENWFQDEPPPPATFADFQARLDSTGNAMSSLRWEGGYATLVWGSTTADEMFEEMCP